MGGRARRNGPRSHAEAVGCNRRGTTTSAETTRWPVRCSVSTFVATAALVAACVAGPSQPGRVALGQSFTLRVGESAQIEAEALRIGFENVSADSRCPKGEQCISEGDATVRVWLQKAPAPKETRELHTSPKEQGAVSDLSYDVRLLRLDPYPVTGRTIAQGDYVATLALTRGSSAAPDR